MKEGLHRDITKQEYLSDPCPEPSLSASIAKLLLSECPASAWCAHPRGGAHREDPTAAMVRGSVYDSLILGGDSELVALPSEMPDAKGKMVPTNGEARLASAREWKDQQEAAGKLVVGYNKLQRYQSAAEAIKENLAEAGIQLDGENQVTAIWRPGGLCWARARFDHLKLDQGLIFDGKSIACAHPDAAAKAIVSLGYDIQEAAYAEALETLFPDLAGRVQFRFFFFETGPPYNVLVRPTSGAMRALGKWKWQRACRQWTACLEANKWPGYVGADALNPPTWALMEMEAELGSSQPPF